MNGMGIGEAKRKARVALSGKWGMAILIVIITDVITSGVPFAVKSIINGGVQFENSQSLTAGDLFSILVTFFLSPLSIGCSWLFLRIVRREPAAIEGLFAPFQSGKYYGKSLLLSFLMGLYTFLWSLLLIVPGIIKGLAYSQTYYLFKDHPDYTPNQLITESRRMMDGRKWEYFLLGLSFIGWAILCIISLGIGFLWLIPYVNTSLAAFYEGLKQNTAEV